MAVLELEKDCGESEEGRVTARARYGLSTEEEEPGLCTVKWLSTWPGTGSKTVVQG